MRIKDEDAAAVDLMVVAMVRWCGARSAIERSKLLRSELAKQGQSRSRDVGCAEGRVEQDG